MDPPPATQFSGKSRRTYHWVFLFHFDVDNEFPFSSVLLEKFDGTDFPTGLITGHLGLDDRLKPRTLSRLPGQKYCVFCKVEEGAYIAILHFVFLFFFILMRIPVLNDRAN